MAKSRTARSDSEATIPSDLNGHDADRQAPAETADDRTDDPTATAPQATVVPAAGRPSGVPRMARRSDATPDGADSDSATEAGSETDAAGIVDATADPVDRDERSAEALSGDEAFIRTDDAIVNDAGDQPAVDDPEATDPRTTAALQAVPADSPVSRPGDTGAATPSYLLEIPGPANPSPTGADAAYYQPNAEGGWDLVFCPLDGGPIEIIELPVQLKPTLGPDGDIAASTGPVWSPDGHFLALTCVDPETGRDAIWLIETGTGVFRPLVRHAADDRSPQWSPDSRIVAFTSNVNGRDRIAIAEARPPEGSEPYAIYLTDGVQDDRDPAWLHGGQEITFRRRQADPDTDHIWVVSIVTGELRQITGREGRIGLGSSPAYRHSPVSSPDKPQIAYATNEKEWDLIAIANSENGTGWTLAGEAGDKADPQWSPDGKKIAYSRTLGTVTNVCTKGTAAAITDVLDPGQGVAKHPRWLADGRLIYWYSDAIRAPRLILQAAGQNVERTVLGGPAARAATPEPSQPNELSSGEQGDLAGMDEASAGATAGDANALAVPEPADLATTAAATSEEAGASSENDAVSLTEIEAETPAAAPEPPKILTGDEVRRTIPPIDDTFVLPTLFDVHTPDHLKLTGLMYHPTGDVADMAVLSIGMGPPARADQSPDTLAQALVAAGYPTLLANLRGTPGLGRNIQNGLADLADFETETEDTVTAARALQAEGTAVPDAIAVLGAGFGGSLALTAAGGRPGVFSAVIAIDPIVDWHREFDAMSPARRHWFQKTFGLPLAEAGRYALRTPTTFAGIIDAPVLLISRSDEAAVDADLLTGLFAELEIPARHVRVEQRSLADLAPPIIEFLRSVSLPESSAEV